MEENSKVYRIRTKVGEDSPNVIHVPINQTYDTFEILSLKLNQTDTYKTYESGYGIIVGRVIANGGFGVPNSKVSVFIEVDDNESLKDKLLYNFKADIRFQQCHTDFPHGIADIPLRQSAFAAEVFKSRGDSFG